MEQELTHGPVMKTMLRFAVPMILGDLLQQCYNIADTLIVGRFLGENALAAVGSAFSLMTFLTSIILGLAMGSGTVFSIRFGQKDEKGLKEGILASFTLLGVITIFLNLLIFAGIDWIIWFLRTPDQLVNILNCARDPYIYQIGSMVFRQIPFIMLFYTLAAAVFLPVIYRCYRKYGMKKR